MSLHIKEIKMIEINGHSFSGSVVKNDESELIVSVITTNTMPDMCLILTDVNSVTETTQSGTSVIEVNRATYIGASVKGVYTITFSKRLSVMDEMSEAIDRLLLLALEV